MLLPPEGGEEVKVHVVVPCLVVRSSLFMLLPPEGGEELKVRVIAP